MAALGASTKGNVLLQYCGLTESEICCIGEVNEDKFGSYTPGTWIPIIPEDELLGKKPDYLIVLPWHFKNPAKEKARLAELNEARRKEHEESVQKALDELHKMMRETSSKKPAPASRAACGPLLSACARPEANSLAGEMMKPG